MCVVDVEKGSVVDAVFLGAEETRNVALPVASENVAIVNLEDLTTLYAIKGLNF